MAGQVWASNGVLRRGAAGMVSQRKARSVEAWQVR
nr:MAG TPA: hypothetical protein [Caudoviricetes sp.]